MGLSGLGDLLLTCTGPASRNFSLGLALGRGERLADVLAARSAVTEGVATAPALVARAAGVDMPICAAVAELLAGRTTLAEAIAQAAGAAAAGRMSARLPDNAAIAPSAAFSHKQREKELRSRRSGERSIA